MTTFAGSSPIQSTARTASFSFYNGYSHMAIDNLNHIFIGDMTGIDFGRNDMNREIMPSGDISTYCGTSKWSMNTDNCSEANIGSRFGVGVGPNGVVYYWDTIAFTPLAPALASRVWRSFSIAPGQPKNSICNL